MNTVTVHMLRALALVKTGKAVQVKDPQLMALLDRRLIEWVSRRGGSRRMVHGRSDAPGRYELTRAGRLVFSAWLVPSPEAKS